MIHFNGFVIFMFHFNFIIMKKYSEKNAVMARVKQIFANGDAAAVVRCVAYNPEAQQMLFLPENKDYLEEFVRYGHEFCGKNVARFVAVATPEMLKNYFEMGYLLDADAQLLLVQRFGGDVLASYLEYDMLCDCVQERVLELFSFEKMKSFVAYVGGQGYQMSELVEEKLFENRSLTLISVFIYAGGVFSPHGECALIRLGVQELTDAYFSQRELGAEAAVLLDGREAPDGSAAGL